MSKNLAMIRQFNERAPDIMAARKRAIGEMRRVVVAEDRSKKSLSADGYLSHLGCPPEHAAAFLNHLAVAYDREMIAEWQRVYAPIEVSPEKKSRRLDGPSRLALHVLSCVGAGWLAWAFLVPALNWIIRSLT